MTSTTHNAAPEGATAAPRPDHAPTPTHGAPQAVLSATADFLRAKRRRRPGPPADVTTPLLTIEPSNPNARLRAETE